MLCSCSKNVVSSIYLLMPGRATSLGELLFAAKVRKYIDIVNKGGAEKCVVGVECAY